MIEENKECPECGEEMGRLPLDVALCNPEHKGEELCFNPECSEADGARLMYKTNFPNVEGSILSSKRFGGVSLESFSLEGKDKRVKRAFRVVKKWTEKLPDKGITLCGVSDDCNVGVGKTHLLAALCRQAKSPAAITSIGFFKKLKDAFGDDQNSNAVDAICRTPIFFLDDLGAEQITEWSSVELLRLLNSRYNSRFPFMFVATNYSIEGLARRYGKFLDKHQVVRIISRIRGMTEIIPVTGKDNRI